jgi:hypothetical protein
MYSKLTFPFLLHAKWRGKISQQKNYDNTPCEFITGIHKAEKIGDNLSQTRMSKRAS